MKILYFIALIPPPDLERAVAEFKTEMKVKYHSEQALRVPSHITLEAPFRIEEDEESQLVCSLAEFAEDERPFNIVLSGFGCFPPRVIFVRIPEHELLSKLQKRLEVFLKKRIGIIGRRHPASFHPHMTIARKDLIKPEFERAWEEFAERPFHASFSAKSMFLLRHNGKSWDVFREFDFGMK